MIDFVLLYLFIYCFAKIIFSSFNHHVLQLQFLTLSRSPQLAPLQSGFILQQFSLKSDFTCSKMLVLCAVGFQDRPDHSHESARLVSAEPGGLLHPCWPVEAGVGEGRPGPRQPPLHPTSCCEVGTKRGCFKSNTFNLCVPEPFKYRLGKLCKCC